MNLFAGRPVATDRSDSPSLNQVDRAIGEIRRGGTVVAISAGVAAVVGAVETLDARALGLFGAASGRDPQIVLTAARATSIGLAVCSGQAIGAWSVPQAAMARALADIADPTALTSAVEPSRWHAVALPPQLLSEIIELMKLARLLPAALVETIELGGGGVGDWAEQRGLLTVTAEAIRGYQALAAQSLQPVGEGRVPLAGAENARIVAFRPRDGGIEHLAVIVGEPSKNAPVLTRLHSQCFTGDLLGSLRCDCGDQLRGAIAEIGKQRAGILLYLAQEGRGIGLVNKLRAYRLQDSGADTAEANRQLGFEADERIYLPAAEMLRRLGFTQVRLLTNNPAKVEGLRRCGIAVTERVPHVFPANPHSDRYLAAKAARLGHML